MVAVAFVLIHISCSNIRSLFIYGSVLFLQGCCTICLHTIYNLFWGGGLEVQVNLYLDDGDVSLIKDDSLVKGI